MAKSWPWGRVSPTLAAFEHSRACPGRSRANSQLQSDLEATFQCFVVSQGRASSRAFLVEEMVGKLATALSTDSSGTQQSLQQLREAVAHNAAGMTKNASDYEHLDKMVKSQDVRCRRLWRGGLRQSALSVRSFMSAPNGGGGTCGRAKGSRQCVAAHRAPSKTVGGPDDGGMGC